MAGKALKGLTIKIGGDTQELSKALDGIEKQGRSLSGELGQINRLLKLDPGNTELLAQKQRVLAEAISTTESKLQTLREAEKQAQEQFERGEISEAQYRALQREIIATERQLEGYRNAAQETADEVERLGDGSKDAAGDIEKTEKAAKDAEQAVDDMGSSLAAAAKTGFSALVAAATAAIAAIVAVAESTREYRTAMGKLDTAFTDAGHSSATATETYKELQSVLGDSDQAVEAASHLAKLCDTEEELAQWTEIATGVFAVFGDSLPIEGLAEAANETAKVGQVTGPLADALNWAAEEGMDFGLVLKKNIDFTELSAQELDQLTDAQREEYEARKAQHDAIEDYNKRLEEATSVEDKFNIALENCTDEQERQKLITDTLTKLYGSAAAQYKKTNAEVIRANKATEDWNAEMAELGESMEPVVTDVKELGVSLLKDAQEPMKKVADFIRTKLLPALTSAGGWVKQNLPQITAVVAGLAAAIVVYKVSVLAAELAAKGLTVATLAQAAAQKVLNAVMRAGPFGLVATAVIGLTAAFAALNMATREAEEPVDVLTEAERELMAAADETAKAFRDQQAATQETFGGITAEMGHVSDLATELQGLADASGRVKEKDQERAAFILNELNNALGTEYQMTGGVIQQYDELKTSIDAVIQAKLANSLLEAGNADYIAAIQNEAGALENLNLKEQDYQNQLSITDQKRQELVQAEAEYAAARAAYAESYSVEAEREMIAAAANVGAKRQALNDEEAILAEKKTAYDQSAADYSNYYNTIKNYEEAQTAALSGNYDKTVELLTDKSAVYGTYSEKVDEETAQVLNALKKEAIDAGLEAQRTKKNFEDGVDGYTEEMVKEAEDSYQRALDAYADAYADAESVGDDMGDGLSDGLENNRLGLYAKAKNMVSGIIAAMREAADSHSPSRKTIAFGEDMGEGAEIGIENTTGDVERAATRQASAILDAYSSQEVAGQKALRHVADQQSARQITGQMAAATANGPVLDRILAAIEKGQVLLLDGNTLVGATAGKMDNTLGQRQVMVGRGAL